jgi:TrmH family RNA methyltransferase
LPPTDQLDRVVIVLMAPRNPLNIGAAARAMANFGFSHLTVVAPYEPHWREAQSAVGAEALLQNARRTGSLAEAVADCTLVLGTGTLEHRKPEQPVLLLPELASHLRGHRAPGRRVALVFGPEKHGLTREDLSYCHHLLVIPTAPQQPSMNLGQAVAVCLYELATRLAVPEHEIPSEPATLNQPPASAADLHRLAGVVEETMQAAGYSPAAMRAANRHDLDLLLRRLTLNAPDATRLLGLFRRILWRLRH